MTADVTQSITLMAEPSSSRRESGAREGLEEREGNTEILAIPNPGHNGRSK